MNLAKIQHIEQLNGHERETANLLFVSIVKLCLARGGFASRHLRRSMSHRKIRFVFGLPEMNLIHPQSLLNLLNKS